MSLPVLFFCFPWLSFYVDDAIIHEYQKSSFLYFVLEYGVHHHLKCGWQVCEPKKHDGGLKQPFWGQECHLPFVAWFDLDIVVSPPYVKLCEQGAPHESINDRGD
jgi:hypothetical protein